LADCFAFFLSAIDLQNKANLLKYNKEIISVVEKNIQEMLEGIIADEDAYGITPSEKVNTMIILIGTDNEMAENTIDTVGRFTLALYLATLIFEGITWEEITDAYKAKSQENINRQNRGY
jgi:hypothetical protein